MENLRPIKDSRGNFDVNKTKKASAKFLFIVRAESFKLIIFLLICENLYRY